MKSSDLVLFRDICDELDDRLYPTLQNPYDEFINDVEKGYKFREYSSRGVEYDFDDMEEKLDVKLRYYQRMALYFTKYYFDKKYLISGNENNKLTYWMATGSGKTVIMKANIIDYFEYLRDKNPDEIEVIITSPLKELIGQLQKEMSEFFTHEFFRDFKFRYKVETTQGLISQYENESYEIVGENHFRLLLVDEAHIGLGTETKTTKGAFVNIRNELTKNISNSFMFEYSATFYDIKDKDQIADYANRIIYEYDYGKFYNDSYGKDFKFDVIKKDDIAEDENKDIKRNLNANLDAFDKKINAFNEFNDKFKSKQFPNRPLLIMAGNTVSASKEKTANNEENSDISKIIDYLANLSDGLIKKYIRLFNENKGVLHLLQNSSNDGELLMAYGEDAIPFGLVTVGDVKKFLDNSNIQKLISNGKIISKAIKFTDENYLFKNIDFESSPINILIGSRKFSAGWNSFRASQICLINFGTGSGPTIIQMFGRGVRLRGLNNDGKRSEKYYVREEEVKNEFLPHTKDNVTSYEKYNYLKYLETLFIYSLRSTYLSKFVEEDTDIYKKSINFTKQVEVQEVYKEKKLPIFYIDKSVSEIQSVINVDSLTIKNNSFNLHYNIDAIKNNTLIDLPLSVDLTIEKENTVKFTDVEWLQNFIDISFIEKLINKKQEQNKINIADFNLSYIVELLKYKNVIIKYDGKITSPKQFQKLIIKVSNVLISKIKNKIAYNETKQNYDYSQTITNEDYIDKYDIKFILDKNVDTKTISDRLQTNDSYKMFIDTIINHYYKPLAIDPQSNSKTVFETYQECLDINYTENHRNIIDSDDKYFENIEEVKITPDKLNADEFKFICDLQKYINKNNLNVVILRNKSKGNIGLIANDDSGVFYPDFILWYMDQNNQQHIIFCDPKGIRNSETRWKVCKAPYCIKELENDKKWDKNIKLHSFIISNTQKKDVTWSPIDKLESIEQCDVFFNLVFMDDKDYIKRIFEGINQDIKIHQHFIKYLENYDENIINEWLDDKKRIEHLKNIESIKELKDTELSKKLLVYFLIYKNRDKLKEDIFDDTKEEIKSFVLDEILPETLSAILPAGRILYKTGKWLHSKI